MPWTTLAEEAFASYAQPNGQILYTDLKACLRAAGCYNAGEFDFPSDQMYCSREQFISNFDTLQGYLVKSEFRPINQVREGEMIFEFQAPPIVDQAILAPPRSVGSNLQDLDMNGAYNQFFQIIQSQQGEEWNRMQAFIKGAYRDGAYNLNVIEAHKRMENDFANVSLAVNDLNANSSRLINNNNALAAKAQEFSDYNARLWAAIQQQEIQVARYEGLKLENERLQQRAENAGRQDEIIHEAVQVDAPKLNQMGQQVLQNFGSGLKNRVVNLSPARTIPVIEEIVRPPQPVKQVVVERAVPQQQVVVERVAAPVQTKYVEQIVPRTTVVPQATNNFASSQIVDRLGAGINTNFVVDRKNSGSGLGYNSQINQSPGGIQRINV